MLRIVFQNGDCGLENEALFIQRSGDNLRLTWPRQAGTQYRSNKNGGRSRAASRLASSSSAESSPSL